MAKKYAAFFDLDHTILSESTGRLYVPFALEKKYFKRTDIIFALYTRFLQRAGIISIDQSIERWVKKLKDWPSHEFESTSVEFFHEYVKPCIRPGLNTEISDHRDRGAATAILSASLDFICEPVRRFLEMDDILCTELETEDGRYTGRLKERYCYGMEKLRRAEGYCDRHGFPLADSYYYADSYADLPVLEKVKHPVCVTPSLKLRKTALSRGWKIMDYTAGGG